MKKITLTQGQVALVSDEDYEWLSQFKWHSFKHKHTFYSKRRNGNKNIFMHRQILGLTDPSILADHKDGNGLNNQRDNLRIATKSQNNTNRNGYGTSKYLGVCWDRYNNKWKVSIGINKKQYHLGMFKNEVDAALAYNKKAIELHGEFARLNQTG